VKPGILPPPDREGKTVFFENNYAPPKITNIFVDKTRKLSILAPVEGVNGK
jgi:hypothetical protein